MSSLNVTHRWGDDQSPTSILSARRQPFRDFRLALMKRHFITNTHFAHLLASEQQVGMGRGGDMTGSDQPAATGKQSNGTEKIGGRIITTNKVPAEQDSQLRAFRCMLASMEQSGNLLILIFIPFPGAKSKFYKLELGRKDTILCLSLGKQSTPLEHKQVEILTWHGKPVRRSQYPFCNLWQPRNVHLNNFCIPMKNDFWIPWLLDVLGNKTLCFYKWKWSHSE